MPDPNAAYELLVQVRELAESPTLRAVLLFGMGRASMAAGNHGRAVENFQLYVQEYPAGADRLAVRLQLGEVQQKANQPLLARRSWADLVREIERLRPSELSKMLRRFVPMRFTPSRRPTEFPIRQTTPV